MASETELLDSTGLVAMLRDPNTGEVLHLIFPPGKYEIPLEIHLPARVAKVTLRAAKIARGGEYDVRLVFDTNPEPLPPFLQELQANGTLDKLRQGTSLPIETVTRMETPAQPPAPPAAPLPPPVTSVIAPKPPEVTPVASLQVEPSVAPPEAPQAPAQAPASSATPEGSAAPSQVAQEPPKAPSKEAPKGSGQRNR